MTADRPPGMVEARLAEGFPTVDELRAAGIDLQVQRLADDFDALLSSTWHGRLLLRYTRWRAGRPRVRRDR